MLPPPLEAQDNGVVVRLRVQPGARRNALVVDDAGRIRVALTAPPVDGAANKALVRFMAQALGVRRSQVTLRSGDRGRDKTLFIGDSSYQAVARSLEAGTR